MQNDTMVDEQVGLTFKDLTYSVDLGKKQGTKVILDGISGCFKPGRLTALFGASGCGKTSLMDVLARRKNTGTIEGEIRFAGAPCNKENIKHLCGYVEQFDNLVEVLTVEQMLMYTAELKLPALTRAQQLERCEEVISQLRLEDCRKTVIGGELVTGISGGQKKRVNIGLSLITRPPILFLDEPTTGLDSAMADDVCVIMSLLAAQGRTVHPASSIHPCTAPPPAQASGLCVKPRRGRWWRRFTRPQRAPSRSSTTSLSCARASSCTRASAARLRSTLPPRWACARSRWASRSPSGWWTR